MDEDLQQGGDTCMNERPLMDDAIAVYESEGITTASICRRGLR